MVDVCTCTIDGVKDVEARRLRIFRQMGLIHMRDLATAVVLSLAFDFGADVDAYGDHWMGVSLQSPCLQKPMYVECDHLFDGLAFLWEQLASQFPDRYSRNSAAVTGPCCGQEFAERVSAELLADHERRDQAYRTYRGCNPQVESMPALPTTWGVLQHLSTVSYLLLANQWGAEDLSAAEDRIFSVT